MSYLRFVIPSNDPDSGWRQGLFKAVSDLEDKDELSPDEQEGTSHLHAAIIDRLCDWVQ
jgi:hypothetical protein